MTFCWSISTIPSVGGGLLMTISRNWETGAGTRTGTTTGGRFIGLTFRGSGIESSKRSNHQQIKRRVKDYIERVRCCEAEFRPNGYRAPNDHQSHSIIVVRLTNGPSLWRSHAPTMIRELSGFFHRLDRLSSFLDVEPRWGQDRRKGPQEMCTYDDDGGGIARWILTGLIKRVESIE
jgi:hypothetical protein